ncbi:unnamed protein product [Agarophyton chilense]
MVNINSLAAFDSCRAPYPVLHQGKCYEPCNAGYEGQLEVCKQPGHDSCRSKSGDHTSLCENRSYIRNGATDPGPCIPSSFRRSVATPPSSEESFTMLFLNDPQVVWWQDPPGAEECKGDPICKQRKAEQEALHQVRAMNSIQDLGTWPGTEQRITKPISVVINGDLTQYFHPREFDLFEKYYVSESNSPHKNVLRYPLFLGLGNHDYANNLNDCWWPRGDYLFRSFNGCAQRSVDYIRSILSCDLYSFFPGCAVESFDNPSLAYSWNQGNYHFIQLHNYPTYEASSVEVSKSMDWLKGDLERATLKGKKIVINLHDLGDHFLESDRQVFSDMLEDSSVVAIFCGHVINDKNIGFQNYFGSVPVFRGGHGGEKNRNRFLLVQFARKYLRVLVISSFDGVPRIENGKDGIMDKTILF